MSEKETLNYLLQKSKRLRSKDCYFYLAMLGMIFFGIVSNDIIFSIIGALFGAWMIFETARVETIIKKLSEALKGGKQMSEKKPSRRSVNLTNKSNDDIITSLQQQLVEVKKMENNLTSELECFIEANEKLEAENKRLKDRLKCAGCNYNDGKCGKNNGEN